MKVRHTFYPSSPAHAPRRWEGKVNRDSELLLIAKTRAELLDTLTAAVRAAFACLPHSHVASRARSRARARHMC